MACVYIDKEFIKKIFLELNKVSHMKRYPIYPFAATQR
jgi:hypothetical protein